MRKSEQLSPSQALNRPIEHQADFRDFTYKEGDKYSRRLGFHVGKFGFLIAQQATSELSDILPICPIPFTASWLLGLINMRGNFVPVFDLYQLLEQEKKENVKKSMLLILGEGKTAGAFIVESLPVPLIFTNDDELNTLPPLPSNIASYVNKGYEKNEELWFNFEHYSFFEALATKVAT